MDTLPAADKELRDMAVVVYALYTASLVTGITMIVGLVIAYIKRAAAAGTWLESHYRWQIRTFWWGLLWWTIGFITTLILVGFAILFAATIWFVYRIAKGWLALRDGKEIA